MDKVKTRSIESPIDEDGTMLEEILASSRPSYEEEEIEERTLYEEACRAGLDKRQINIIRMSMDGLTVREIGQRLGISHVAIVKSRKKIMTKCGKLKEEIKRKSYKFGYQN